MDAAQGSSPKRYEVVTDTAPATQVEGLPTQRYLIVAHDSNASPPRVVASGSYSDPITELCRLANEGSERARPVRS